MAKYEYDLVSRINLLPWRDTRREELRKEYFLILALVGALAAATWVAGRVYHGELRANQDARIEYVQGHIASLDKRLIEIVRLQRDRQRLLTRIRAIEELQGNRSLVVRLFDEIVGSVPEELTLTEISQTGGTVKLKGLAQSNASVSTLMRRIEASSWIMDPVLQIIEKKMVSLTPQSGGKYAVQEFNEETLEKGRGKYLDVSQFELTFNQVVPQSGKN